MSKLIGGAAAAAAFAALAELATRSAFRRWGAYYRYTPHWRERLEIDHEALPDLTPIADVEINADGERGGPPPGDDERAFRALVVGGSAAECYYLAQRETWPAVAQETLTRPDTLRALSVDRVHVGNVARAILPCEHIHVLLKRILPRYRRLDVILVMVGASDLVFWLERGMPRTMSDERIDLGKIFELHPEGPWSFHPRRTALWRAASMLNRRLRQPVIRSPGSGGWLHRVRKMRAEAPHVIDDVPDAAPMLDRFGRHLAALLQTARAKASRVIVVRQPWLGGALSPQDQKRMWNFGLGRPYREQVDTYLSHRVVDVLMQLVDERAARVAHEVGVEEIDLLPRLRRDTTTFYDYLHFTPAGARVVGEMVAEAIVAGPRSRT